MNKIVNKVMSAALVMVMVFTLMPMTALATEGEPLMLMPAVSSEPLAQGVTILSFDTLAQTEYEVAFGTAQEDIGLPVTLAAGIPSDEGESTTTVENVTWNGDYEAYQAGVYFLSAYAEGYVLSEGITWPIITVTVLPGEPESTSESALDLASEPAAETTSSPALEPTPELAAEPLPEPDDIDLLIAAIDALPEMDYGDVDMEDEDAFAAWLDEQYAIYAEVPSLYEQLALYEDDTDAMERIGTERTDKLAGLYTMLFGVAVMAETADKWTSYAAAGYASGGGQSASDPYIITTPEQLAFLANQVNGSKQAYSGKYFKLGANIDLSAHYWTPIGHDDVNFKGTFDGAGYTIYGMNVVDGYRSNPSEKWLNAGFFGTADAATIKSVNLVGATINVTQTYDQTINVGGLGGYICNSDVTDCSFNGTIYAKFAYGTAMSYAGKSNIYIGGIVGRTYKNSGSYGSNFTNCAAFGSITAEGSVYRCVMGGIGGETSWGGSGKALMTNCYANSTLNDTTSCVATPYVGGVVGNANMKNTSSLMYYRYPEAAEKGFGNIESSLSQSTAEYYTDDQMKTAMISNLSDWKKSDDVNSGYPISTALYGVTYDANGGSGATTGKAAFGYSLTLPADPTRSGYTFTGWYDASTGGTQYKKGDIYLRSEGITLYAHWVCSGHVYDNNCDTNCNTCGETRSITHSWTPATCTSPKTCSVCRITEGTARGHTSVVDPAVAATCTATGLTEGAHCSVCSVTLTTQETVNALGHSYTAVVTAPTCTAQGYTTHTCTRCSDSYIDTYVNALDHNMIIDAAVAPTCTATGLTEGSHCSRCDGATTAQTEVSALGHTEVADVAVAATCTAAGKTAGSHCSVCSEIIVAQTVVPALTHSWGAPSYTWNGTSCTAQRVCGRDSNHKETETVTVTSQVTQEKSCTLDELSTYTANFVNSAFATQTKTGVKTADKLNHSYTAVVTAPTCTTQGYTTHTCTLCSGSYVDTYVSAKGHTEVTDEAVAATCTAAGKTAGSHCSVCHVVLTEQQTVTALGHTEVIDVAVAPTCTTTGLTEGKHCSVCNDVLVAQTEVAALGHTEVTDEAVAPTCTATGLTEGSHCSVCSEVLVAQTEVAALGHTETTDAAVAPTCTETGLTEGSHCSVCDMVLTAQAVVPALNHDYSAEFTVDTEATCEETGSKSKHCSRCDSTTEITEIVATGHTWGDWISNGDGTETRICTKDDSHNETQNSKYTVSLNANDGTINNGNVTEYTFGTGAALPTEVTKIGYTFGGWYTNDSFTGSPVTAITKTDFGDKTYYTKWVLKAPSVELTPSGSNVAYGTNITLTAVANHALTTGVTYSYEWYKDNNKINDSTNILTISNVSESGSYKVKVTAKDGTLTSDAVESSTVSVTISAVAHGKPDAPVLATNGTTYNSITVATVSGQKYICRLATYGEPATGADGWQDTGTFTGLAPNREYKVYTYMPKTDSNHTDSAVSTALDVTTNKVKITDLTAPGETRLADYYDTGEAAKAGLSASTACTSEDGDNPSLDITWTAPQTYNSAPDAENTFEWSISAPTNYEFATSVVSFGSITVTNKEATAVNITVTKDPAKLVRTYGGTTFDVTDLFEFDGHEGSHKYFLNGGTENGSITENGILTVTKAGEFTIKVATAATGNYAAGEETAILTVNKGSVTVPTIASKTYTGQSIKASITGSNADDNYAVTTNDGGIGVDSYDVVLTLNKPDLYKWSDGTQDAAKTLIFDITQAMNKWENELACDGFTYNGTETLAPAARAKFGEVTLTYATVSNGQYAELPKSGIKDAGTYYIKATVEDSINYTGLTTGQPITVTISKVKLTPSVASVNAREYNGDTDATGTISLAAADGYTMPANETPAAFGTFVWTDGDAETTTVDVNSIHLTNYDVNKNYELDAVSLTNVIAPNEAKISPKALDITAQTLTYNGTTTHEVENYSTGVGSETITLNYALTAKDVGDYILGVSDEGSKGFTLTLSDDNYSVKSAGTLTIVSKSLTAPAKTVTYNGDTTFTQEVDGVNGEKVIITYTANTKDASSYAYAYAAAANQYIASTGNANYSVTDGENLTIDKLTAELTWGDDGESTYNGNPRNVTAEVSNRVEGDTVSVTVSGGAETNARATAYTATAIDMTGGDAANYKLPSDATTTYTIKPKSISGASITLGETLTYNGGEQTQEVEKVIIDGLNATFDISDNKQTNAKSDYTLTVTGKDNFTGTQTAVWNIEQKGLTIAAKPQSIIYGRSINMGTEQVEVSGLADGDSLDSITLEPSDNQVAGDKTIAPNAAVIKRGKTVVTNNYSITYNTGTLIINNATMTPDVSGYDDTYDGKRHGITVTMEGAEIKYGTADGIYGLTASPTYANVGEYTVYYQVKKVNYNTVTGSAMVKISSKSIAAVWSGESGSSTDFSWVYDGSSHAPTATAITGVEGETVTLSVSGAATEYKASAYTATASIDPVNDNYTLTNTTHDFNITKADYDMSGVTFKDTTAEYNGEAHSLTVNGTLPTGADGKKVTVSYSGSATNVNEGAVTVTATFATESTNYNTPAAKTAKITVTTAPLTVSVKNDLAITKTYDGDDTIDDVQTNWLVVEGLKNSETATATGTWQYDSTHVGDTKTINVTDITIRYGSANASNYSYTQTDITTNGTITDATITPGALGVDVTYDGKPHAITVAPVTVNGQTASVSYKIESATDFETANPDFTNAGEYTVYYKITASNHADEIGSVTVKIKPKTLENSMIGSIHELTYDGEAQRPESLVSWTPRGESLLTLTAGEDKDFTFSYANNTNAALSSVTKAPTVIITATEGGNYSGSAYKTFTIEPLTAELTWKGYNDLVYDGRDKTVTATVSNKAMGDGDVDFELVYSDNIQKNAGDYRAAVTSLGNTNYTLDGATGKTLDWMIQKAPISFTAGGNEYTYDAQQHTATVAQTDEQTPVIAENKFSVSYQSAGETATADKTDAGEYDIIVTLTDDNFCFVGEQDEETRSHTQTEKLTISKKPVTAQWQKLIHVYDGTAKTPVFVINDGDIFDADSGEVSVELGTDTKTAAETYTVTASLTGNRAGNYELTNPTGSLIIQKAPVTFTVSDNSAQHDGSRHLATVTATANGSRFTDFTISYKNAKGETVNNPKDEGSYDIYAAITSRNHRHFDAADGASRKIGVLTIYRAVEPQTYTVSFAGGEGATGSVNALSDALSGTPRVLPENPAGGFEKDNNRFGGWKYDGRIYQPGEVLTQPAANITLTAVWIEETYLIEGVVDEAGNPLADVVITLMLGSHQIDQTQTNQVGEYSFTDIVPGLYNLVASKNGITQTILVEIVAANETGKNITMPMQKTNSVVEVAAGSPVIVVGELNNTFAPEDVEAARIGSVEMKLTVEAVTRSQDEVAIESKSGGTVGLLLDVTLTKTVIDADGIKDDVASGEIKESPVLLQIVIKLPGELQRKSGYTVLRSHDGEVQTLTSTPNATGEYIFVNADRTAITVYAKYFSAYAVSYTDRHSGNTGYKPAVSTVEHGTVVVAPANAAYGTIVTVTVTPEDGYKVGSLIVTDSSGNQLTLSEKADGTFTFMQPRGSVTVNASFRLIEGMPFTDVKERDWFYDDVYYVYENGLMQGTSLTSFSPHLDTSRGMIVTILYRLEGGPAITGDCPFNDVAYGKYYEKAVIWVATNSIVDGYGNGKFGPDDNITREQMAAILYRYAKYKGYDVTASADLTKFNDMRSINGYALVAMQWANANELINGKGNGILDPGGSAERCQVAAILHRFCENIMK